jgi:predicted RNase H-like nuclease (RuvC/YqgF family)
MNPFEMVIGIVLIVSIASVLKARFGVRTDKWGGEYQVDTKRDDAESRMLREEIRSLKERIQVLERVITDTETGASRLDREIEQLRDKNRV